jgi:hypothetical protein
VLNFTFGELGIRHVIESNLWVNSKEKKILTLKIWMFYNFYQRGNLPMSEFIKHQQHSLSSDFHVFLSQYRKTEEPDLSVSKKTCKQSAVQPFAHNVRKFRSIATLYGYFKMLSCAAPKAQRPKSMGRCEEFLLNFVPYWTWGTQYRCEQCVGNFEKTFLVKLKIMVFYNLQQRGKEWWFVFIKHQRNVL